MLNQFKYVQAPRPLEFSAKGKHLLLELFECDSDVLRHKGWITSVLTQAAETCRCTVVKEVTQSFTPEGVSCVLVLAESHISIHTWPEHGRASIDFYTCGDEVSPVDGEKILMDAFGAKRVKRMLLHRGDSISVVLDDEVIPSAESRDEWGRKAMKEMFALIYDDGRGLRG